MTQCLILKTVLTWQSESGCLDTLGWIVWARPSSSCPMFDGRDLDESEALTLGQVSDRVADFGASAERERFMRRWSTSSSSCGAGDSVAIAIVGFSIVL